MASHRHSQCFEGIINFSIHEPLAEDQGSHSQRRFYNNVNSNSTKDGFTRPFTCPLYLQSYWQKHSAALTCALFSGSKSTVRGTWIY
ncbi:conserved hypothetical protein [Coccidioides posadasii str. Silveira]|uniref:Uncharacterized protein n=1 Tax=Coccidioides posadasii (strain RMSCC 757 / Silveira) TaxID=443226 RepID=E9D2Z8_COCPS|nr:conserved hypothetical protein [Coccidioides posadasii str. Silveira]